MADTKYTYSVSTNTLNGVVSDKLDEEIRTSAIVTAFDNTTIEADVLDLWFKDALSASDKTILDGLVAAHDGLPLEEPLVEQPVKVNNSPAFASKKVLVGGAEKSLFKRVHGVFAASIPANTTGYLELIVPYPTCKFSGAEIFGAEKGDTLDFFILDDDNNTYSGAPIAYPNWLLNQFGFDVQMPGPDYKNTSNYDADLYYGMVISCAFKNNGPDPKIITGNYWLHEVK